MKTTLSHVRQMFNVKEIAEAGLTPDKVEQNKFAIIDEKTNLTVLPSSFNDLPKDFRFILKTQGNVLYSFDTIKKSRILNQTVKKYTEEKLNKWKTVIESCDCTKTVRLDIHIDEASLTQQDGMTWTHWDTYVEVSPKEFACYCDCSGKGVYENNVMTMLLYKRIKEQNSPFYDAEVHVVGGSKLNDLNAIKKFIADNKEINTDDDESNDEAKLELHIVAKSQLKGTYKNIDINYVYPKGVKLNPTLVVNDIPVQFEETQEFKFAIGNGYDLRAEEWENMNNYTTLNYYPRLSDGLENPELVYQFENNKQYDTVTFEFDSLKQNRAGEGDMKRFMIILGSETGNGVFDKLKTVFGPQD